MRDYTKKVIRSVYAGVSKPYAKAVRVGDFVFCSGMAGIDPNTNQIVTGLTVRETVRLQTEMSVKKIEAILKEAGSSLEDVFKTTILVVNLDHYDIINEVLHNMFPKNNPPENHASTLMEVGLNPNGVLVEIEVIALVRNDKGER